MLDIIVKRFYRSKELFDILLKIIILNSFLISFLRVSFLIVFNLSLIFSFPFYIFLYIDVKFFSSPISDGIGPVNCPDKFLYHSYMFYGIILMRLTSLIDLLAF